MATPSTFDLYDRLVFNGTFAEKLTEWRAEGMSYENIAFRLREHGVVVTITTVWRWVRDLEEVKAS